ncbi:MAG: prephenate dehydrogenase/arogenate dehydrogenase family protein [Chloroflexi bacterium]|nr:prephenate dehydrogenase/arogenate dehydrogenase family protein [Chloroflexota bacterium]
MSDNAIDGFTLHIIGLGLMGGSLAMALRGHVNRITAQDANPANLEAALQSGVIDGVGGLEQADIVILAVPSDRIPLLIQQICTSGQLKNGALVMDIGSTKGRICDTLDTLPKQVAAIGGHPMCGLAENGYRNAIPTLFKGARFVLCETVLTTPAAREVAEKLVTIIGARPLWMDRYRHDALTALTSHLPHVLSFALMRLAMEASAEDEALFQLAAGGFDGATRLARTEENMITGMFTTNAAQIRPLLARLRNHIDTLDALFDNPDELREELARVVEARRLYTKTYGERPIS